MFNAYLHCLVATRDPIGLLRAIYIIEGTGQRIVPALLLGAPRHLILVNNSHPLVPISISPGVARPVDRDVASPADGDARRAGRGRAARADRLKNGRILVLSL